MGLRLLVWSVLLIVPGRRFGAAFERVALLQRPGGVVRALKDRREAQRGRATGRAVRAWRWDPRRKAP
jgi:hypothetical protein